MSKASADDKYEKHLRKEIERDIAVHDLALWDREMKEELGTKHDLLIHAMELICDE